LEDYIDKVVLEVSFFSDENLYKLLAEYGIVVNKETQHFLGGVNYLTGIRITRKQTELEVNDDSISKNVIKEVRPQIYNTVSKKYNKEQTSSPPNYERTGGYNNKGGYVLYLRGDSTLDNARDDYDTFKSSFKEKGMISLTLEFMFYNVNYGQFLYKAQKFLVTHQSTIRASETVRGFDPTLFKTNNKSQSHRTAIIAMSVLFQVLVLYTILKLIFTFIYYILDIISNKRIYISANDIASLIVVAFALASIAYWYRTLVDLKYIINLNLVMRKLYCL
jgi:hypothetical protein